jgi:two-component system, chemotaxis family, chemotaxis protein CheY
VTRIEPLVFVVDDNDDIRQSVADLVARAGYAVQQASNGAEALALLRAGMVPRAILLDLNMPQVDGWTVLVELEADPKLSWIPVIVMSAEANVPPNRTVIRKPFDSEDLLRALRTLTAKIIAR